MEDCLRAGILPEHFWSMTPSETVLWLRGHKDRDMQMSLLLSTTLNAQRGRRSARVWKWKELSVFSKDPLDRDIQSPEEMASGLRKIAAVFGGMRKKRER